MNNVLVFGFLMGKSPMELFVAGGPIMWPMLFLSLLAMTVVIERLIFIARERFSRKPHIVGKVLNLVSEGEFKAAANVGVDSSDMLGRVLGNCLKTDDEAKEDAFAEASSREISRYQQGLPVLDTAITAAPLLGLLGTVTGMMGSFGEITGDLGAPTAITGGIAEALVATAAGLLIAIMCLMPYNFINARIEDARRAIEESGSLLEIALAEAKKSPGERPGEKVALLQ